MKLKKCISLLLFAVYLFAAGGPAYASLSCHCVAMKAHAAHHIGCHHCPHVDHTAGKALSAPCCGNHHSTEVKLYTGSGSDTEKYTRCTVTLLPAALTAEREFVPDVVVTCDKIAERRAPFLKRAYIRSIGFRAPPVLA